MSDVDWLVGSVVVGDQRALDRGAELPVEPDPGGQGGQPLGDPDPEALDGVGAVAFQAELVFEVSMMASIHWRTPPRLPNRYGSSRRSGRAKLASTPPPDWS